MKQQIQICDLSKSARVTEPLQPAPNLHNNKYDLVNGLFQFSKNQTTVKLLRKHKLPPPLTLAPLPRHKQLTVDTSPDRCRHIVTNDVTASNIRHMK
jgi:hypothetical protein